MTFNDILKESWLSISGNKIRSFLTILGIIIGVMAVVVMVTFGETVQKKIDDQFSSLGTSNMTIRPGAAQASGVRTGNRMTLTIQDADAIRQLPGVVAVAPVKMMGSSIIYGNQNWSTSVVGTNTDYQIVNSIEIQDGGTFFDYSAQRNGANYVVLGPKVVDSLQMPANPVGQIVRVGNVPCIVVGVMKSRGDTMGGNQDDMAILPITTLTQRLQSSRFPDAVSMITLKLAEDADNTLSMQTITELLRERHKLKDGDADDFQIMSMQQVLDTMNTITGFMKMLLISIASVSLLVGSIGIMNMMLVSVAERTREIGIRKAIGAKERHIITQFLSESILISFIGSMMGLIIGVVLAKILVPIVLQYSAPISIPAIILSVVVAVVVGIASGVFPAFKAARLNPIDSLRNE
ncbi:MAG: ABC transporter permease [Proteobacteria bacterium]|nr:ABC transporter permease [Pseudomonadota bacterium]